uniref:Uncharacterized protein n=1 Tax=Timema cristinae TaxID=61476 RepID=A0A7R9DCS1_TIMCR|nr:unnamed protein product [Timema cristinae]
MMQLSDTWESECQTQAHTPKHNLGVSPPHNTGDTAKKHAAKKKLADGNEPVKSNSKPKKTSTPKAKKIVQPITLDMTGRPVFPIVLGGLTIHSLGEYGRESRNQGESEYEGVEPAETLKHNLSLINKALVTIGINSSFRNIAQGTSWGPNPGPVVSDRPDYHSEELIFPVGFCSSRMYGSLKDPEKKCVYTCKILDGGYSPSFEIVADNELEYPLVGESASDCHTLLLHKINLSLGFEVVSTRGRGPEFFGFSHPTILNLIQSSPGTRKCASYKWSRFEVSKTGEPPTEERDAALSYEALQRSIIFAKSHLLTAKKEESQEQLMSNANTTLRDLLMSVCFGACSLLAALDGYILAILSDGAGSECTCYQLFRVVWLFRPIQSSLPGVPCDVIVLPASVHPRVKDWVAKVVNIARCSGIPPTRLGLGTTVQVQRLYTVPLSVLLSSPKAVWTQIHHRANIGLVLKMVRDFFRKED